MLGLEGDWKWVVSLVLRHCRYRYVLRIWKVGFGRSVDVSYQLSNLADPIRSIIEKEERIIV